VNQLELDKLDTETKVFNMTSKGNKKAVESLIKRCLAPESLVIKTGAEVMFVANSQTKNFVNGTLGRIVDFDEEGLPIVKTKNRLIYVQPHTWKTEDGPKVVAEISQLPLRLAWAITVHKSQGMSLDAAEIDLTNSFEPGMGYVALSRVRSIEGLFIKGINNMAMVVNPKIIELDAKLKAQSAAAQQSLSGIKQDEINRHQQSVRTALRPDEEKLIEGFDEVLFDKLKSWRSDLATKQSAPAYTVLPDKSLKLIAAIKPKDQQQLAQIHGIGPAKLEKYADQILPIVNTA
jgi:superfamily II DNA helicase RecQ